MPLVTIKTQDVWSGLEKRRISDSIHEALVEAFRIPESDYHHRFIIVPISDWIHSGRKTDRNLLIEMTVFPGRSRDAKKKLYALIAEKLSLLGIAPDETTVVLLEPPMENWGLAGRPGDEVDIGFSLNL